MSGNMLNEKKSFLLYKASEYENMVADPIYYKLKR